MSISIAVDTIRCINQIVTNSTFNCMRDIMVRIKYAAKLVKKEKDIQNKKLRFIVKNMIKKVQLLLFVILEEMDFEINQNNYEMILNTKMDKSQIETIRQRLLEEIETLQIETEEGLQDILRECPSLLNSNEIILISDYSLLVVHYLVQISRLRKIQVEVVIVESSVEKGRVKECVDGLSMGVFQSITIIPETSIFAVMNKISKVFLEGYSIMNNGGAITYANGLLIATACKNFQVPFLLFSYIHNLTSKFPLDQSTFNQQINPAYILNLDPAQKYSLINTNHTNLNVLADKFNYIDNIFISLIITNLGAHTPQHIYRLFEDYYGREIYRTILSQFKKYIKNS